MNAASCSEKRIQSNVFWIVPYSGLLHAVIMAVKDTFHIFPINIFLRIARGQHWKILPVQQPIKLRDSSNKRLPCI